VFLLQSSNKKSCQAVTAHFYDIVCFLRYKKELYRLRLLVPRKPVMFFVPLNQSSRQLLCLRLSWFLQSTIHSKNPASHHAAFRLLVPRRLPVHGLGRTRRRLARTASANRSFLTICSRFPDACSRLFFLLSPTHL